jgi:hypothetical protein
MESVSNTKTPGIDGDGSSDSGILLAMTTQEDIRVVQTKVKQLSFSGTSFLQMQLLYHRAEGSSFTRSLDFYAAKSSKVYSSTLISSQESGNECPRSQWAFENSQGKRRQAWL